MLFQKGVDAVKREWGIRLKASARRLEDTVGERWLQDWSGEDGQLSALAQKTLPRLHSFDQLHHSCSSGSGMSRVAWGNRTRMGRLTRLGWSPIGLRDNCSPRI